MDSVAQFITEIRNGSKARLEKVDTPNSKMRQGIAQILADEGCIRSFKVAKDSKQGIMRIYLKYNEDGTSTISNLLRISRPGRRLYIKKEQIPIVRSGLGFAILSTSKGIMSGRKATEAKLGGELLCTVW